MFIIFITILLTVVIMQNTDRVRFSFLFSDFMVSKLIVLLAVAIIGFIIGVLVGRPRRVKYMPEPDVEVDGVKKRPDTLSDDDRDYIN
jgi:uncharacterized integral membrane protein